MTATLHEGGGTPPGQPAETPALREGERNAAVPAAGPGASRSGWGSALDPAVLLGDWRNTNAKGGIPRIVVEPLEGNRVRVTALDHTTEAPTFAFTFDSSEAGAFNAKFDRGHQRIHMQANVKLGVLVVVTLTEFTDRSGRSNYFDREFYHRIS